MPFEVSGLALLTEALMSEGFPESDIRKIMGENVVSFYLRSLP